MPRSFISRGKISLLSSFNELLSRHHAFEIFALKQAQWNCRSNASLFSSPRVTYPMGPSVDLLICESSTSLRSIDPITSPATPSKKSVQEYFNAATNRFYAIL